MRRTIFHASCFQEIKVSLYVYMYISRRSIPRETTMSVHELLKCNLKKIRDKIPWKSTHTNAILSKEKEKRYSPSLSTTSGWLGTGTCLVSIRNTFGSVWTNTARMTFTLGLNVQRLYEGERKSIYRLCFPLPFPMSRKPETGWDFWQCLYRGWRDWCWRMRGLRIRTATRRLQKQNDIKMKSYIISACCTLYNYRKTSNVSAENHQVLKYVHGSPLVLRSISFLYWSSSWSVTASNGFLAYGVL